MAPESVLDDGVVVDGEFKARSRDLGRQRTDAYKAFATDLPAYVRGMRGYLAGTEIILERYSTSKRAREAREAIANAYLNVGHIARFRMKSPADAMELYEGARRNGSRFAGLAIADAWQFDMKDPKRAIAEYRKILASLPAMPVAGDEASNFAPWARRWVESQIRFLEKGATFSGRLTQDDSRMTAVMTMGILGIPEETFEIGSAVRKASAASRADATRTPEPDKAEVARLLEALPSSTIALLASAPYTYLLPDADSILAFLRRQDPAGFATACFFMMIELYEVAEDKKPPAAMQEAKTRFLRERRIDIGWIADAINRAESERARNK